MYMNMYTHTLRFTVLSQLLLASSVNSMSFESVWELKQCPRSSRSEIMERICEERIASMPSITCVYVYVYVYVYMYVYVYVYVYLVECIYVYMYVYVVEYCPRSSRSEIMERICEEWIASMPSITCVYICMDVFVCVCM